MKPDLVTALREVVREVVREELAGVAVAQAEQDSYLPTAAAAALVDVAEGTIRRWVREGRLPGHRAGRVLRVRASDLRALLAVGTRAPKRHESLSPEQLARHDFGRRAA